MIDVKVVMDKDMVEIFIEERAAFTYRVYEKTGSMKSDLWHKTGKWIFFLILKS